MTSLTDDRGAPRVDLRPAASPALAHGARWLILRLSTDNPFYVLSALLVLVGLWTSFGAQVRQEQTWALMIGLASYTVMLAVPSCLLVRFGGVWEDVRTVLLVVVLMFLATSVTFDETLTRDPSFGAGCALLGLVFALFVSEGVLRVLRLRLAPGFKIPYQLALTLFYLYPVALLPVLNRPRSAALEWALYGFSPLAGLVALTLLPAVRRGAAYVRDNGSPWQWPFFPWALFVFLGFGVLARSFLLCWSMQHVERYDPERLIFGTYFFAPFLLAVGLLVVEAGLTSGSRRVIRTGLLFPALAVLASGVGHRNDELYREFYDEFTRRLAVTPLFAAVAAAAVFYGVARIRHVPQATRWLVATVLVSSVVGPASRDLATLVAPQPLPLLAASLLIFAVGIRKRGIATCLAGVILLSAAVLGAPWPSEVRLVLAFHLVVVGCLLLGTFGVGELADTLRSLGVVLALGASLAVSVGSIEIPPAVAHLALVYPPLVGIGLAAFGLIVVDRSALVCAGLAGAVWGMALGYQSYMHLRQHVIGLDAIAMGLVLLAIAQAISLAKAGLLPRRLNDLFEPKEPPLADGIE
ncbi:MAG: hypothetical protein U0794_20865 [Isosphaeraceae bacterium]